MYKIVYKKSVKKDTKRIPQAILKLLKIRIQELSLNPYPAHSKKLQGYIGIYRMRVGKYRVLYQVDAPINVITVYKIGHRKDIYRGL